MLDMKVFLEKYYVPLKELDCRLYPEDNVERARNNYQRDYSRILYSTSFRRLQGKMQLLGIRSDKFYRNRLTHSFEVAQIARGIAAKLSKDSGLEDVYLDDIYVVEAGALAHDIGNPPFGHHGERVLNRLMRGRGGFEGNAQTLRVLNNLEKKLPNNKGLNLTLRTMLSVVKYYNTINNNEEKFVYRDDYEKIKSEVLDLSIKPRTVDVQIVDLADEIAYAAHDLEDALSLKLFNIDEFIFEFGKDDNEVLKRLVERAREVASTASIYKSSEEYGFLFRKELTSNLVNTLINDIGVVKVDEEMVKKTGTMNNYELGFQEHKKLAGDLKKFTFNSVNRSDSVQLYEKQGEKVIKGIFNGLSDKEFNKNSLLLPVEFRGENESIERNITDFISGMMDSYAVNYFKQIYGDNAIDQIYDEKFFRDFSL
ncbi:deoxyguanosinetriphosphate triphosphohydrolase family protein [Alkalibacillus haloalkaliphilus]|uniref:Deoxyguanosinetriphosphate triphosphohydrolase n=1 Tax=Alkalibacillus haloalkaliphilus TaxID=94136 RepID=A0A511W7F7_9BACI|nr:dNTP triphosphohydrolase [Alkalibacillus haloalkaliphilus]GEN46661.1 deoxyguanosinetriphosphate triphosphohydrolase [Alkalibacillus haloalkaliphilus]